MSYFGPSGFENSHEGSILVSDLEIALNNRSAGIRSVAGQLVYSCLGQTVHGRGCD